MYHQFRFAYILSFTSKTQLFDLLQWCNSVIFVGTCEKHINRLHGAVNMCFWISAQEIKAIDRRRFIKSRLIHIDRTRQPTTHTHEPLRNVQAPYCTIDHPHTPVTRPLLAIEWSICLEDWVLRKREEINSAVCTNRQCHFKWLQTLQSSAFCWQRGGGGRCMGERRPINSTRSLMSES